VTPTLLHQGMVVVGLPYAFQGQMRQDEITGGSPYGASTITHGDGSCMPSENELVGAFPGRPCGEDRGEVEGVRGLALEPSHSLCAALNGANAAWMRSAAAQWSPLRPLNIVFGVAISSIPPLGRLSTAISCGRTMLLAVAGSR
jgi:hypothetical protein